MERQHRCVAKDCAHCPEADCCPEWHTKFLEALADTSNVSAAAEIAKISTSHVYRVKRNNAEFARRWGTALLEGYENLELETLQRLRHGIPNDDRKYDIANALRLLGAHRDSVAQQRALKAHDNEEVMIKTINAKISALRQVEQTAARTIDLLPDKRPEKQGAKVQKLKPSS